MTPFIRLVASDLRSILSRRWYLALVAVGVVWAIVAATAAAGDSGLAQADAIRSGTASVLLLCGLAVALTLGSTAFWGAIGSGHIGLLVGSGAPRLTVALARVSSRALALCVAIAVWVAVAEIGSVAIGRNLDGPLAVHGLAVALTLLLPLLGAAAISTVLGPTVSAVTGLSVYVMAQATVNLEAAADIGRLGTARQLVHVAYNVLPRAVFSPMIVEMQNRGKGGPAAPQFEINNVPVPLFSASVWSVLWTAGWCAALVWLCTLGIRRRALS